jgi:hypothetical protein
VACRPNFFLPVRVLSRVFRGKFIAHLKQAYAGGEVSFHGRLRHLSQPAEFERCLDRCVRQEWVVYAKPPFGGPQQVLKYLARYTHRVAIANSRLMDLADGRVQFRWKDYADGNQHKTMTLDAHEFIRRFLLHVLPRGFMRIRYYGFLSSRGRQEQLALCRSLLGVAAGVPTESPTAQADSADDPEVMRCPQCRIGHMLVIERFDPPDPRLPQRPHFLVPVALGSLTWNSS